MNFWFKLIAHLQDELAVRITVFSIVFVAACSVMPGTVFASHLFYTSYVIHAKYK